ncbi:hypothetical protein V6N13_037494 [Hibiscus sabdariffa]
MVMGWPRGSFDTTLLLQDKYSTSSDDEFGPAKVHEPRMVVVYAEDEKKDEEDGEDEIRFDREVESVLFVLDWVVEDLLL